MKFNLKNRPDLLKQPYTEMMSQPDMDVFEQYINDTNEWFVGFKKQTRAKQEWRQKYIKKYGKRLSSLTPKNVLIDPKKFTEGYFYYLCGRFDEAKEILGE